MKTTEVVMYLLLEDIVYSKTLLRTALHIAKSNFDEFY
jgi:hypothetical protein